MLLHQTLGYLNSLESPIEAKNEANSEHKQEHNTQDYYFQHGIDIVLRGVSGDIIEKIRAKGLHDGRVRIDKKFVTVARDANELLHSHNSCYEEISGSVHDQKYCEYTFHATDLPQAKQQLQWVNAACNTTEHNCQFSASKPVLFQVELQFISIHQTMADRLLAKQTKGQSTLIFKDLNYDQASSIYAANEKQAAKALLQFPNLSIEQARLLIMHADRRTENFSMDTKPVETEFLKLHADQRWLLELKNYGYSYLFGLKEKSPLPWKSIALLTTLSVAQLATGFALATGTMAIGTMELGTQVGMGLMAEGFSDLVRDIAVAYGRQFELESYLMQKTTSVGLCLATAGYAASGGLTIAGETVEVAKITNFADEAAMLAVRFAKKGLAKTAKKVGKMAGEKVISETVNQSCRFIGGQVVCQNQKAIVTYARGRVREAFATGHWRRILTRAIAIDRFTASNELESRLRDAAQKHIAKATMAIPGLPLCDPNGFDNFYKAFNRELEEIQPQMQQFDQLLIKHLRAEDHREVTDIMIAPLYDRLKQLKIVLPDGTINLAALEAYYSLAEAPKQMGKSRKLEEDKHLQYRVENYNCQNFAQALGLSVSDKLAEHVLKACLDYALFLSNDYAAERGEFVNHLAKDFSELFNRSIAATANVLASMTAAGVNMAISHGFKKAKNKAKEAAKKNQEASPAEGSTTTADQSATQQPATTPASSDASSASPSSVESPSVTPPAVENINQPLPRSMDGVLNENVNNRQAAEAMSQNSDSKGINSRSDNVHEYAKAGHSRSGLPKDLNRQRKVMQGVKHMRKHHKHHKKQGGQTKAPEKADGMVLEIKEVKVEIKHMGDRTVSHRQTDVRSFNQAPRHAYYPAAKTALPDDRFFTGRRSLFSDKPSFPHSGRRSVPFPGREGEMPIPRPRGVPGSLGSPFSTANRSRRMHDNDAIPLSGSRLPAGIEPLINRKPLSSLPRGGEVLIPGQGNQAGAPGGLGSPFSTANRSRRMHDNDAIPLSGSRLPAGVEPLVSRKPFVSSSGEVLLPRQGGQAGMPGSSGSPFSTANRSRIATDNSPAIAGNNGVSPIPQASGESRNAIEQFRQATNDQHTALKEQLDAFDKTNKPQKAASADRERTGIKENMGLVGLREAYFQSYCLKVAALEKQKEAQLKALDTTVSHKNCEILSDLLIDARNRIESLMGAIIVSKRMEQFTGVLGTKSAAGIIPAIIAIDNNKKREMKADITNLSQEEVDYYVANLFERIKDDPSQGFSLIEKELAINFNTCLKGSMVAMLKINFEEYYKSLKYRNTLLAPINVGNLMSNHDLSKIIFDQVDAGNYRQCGRYLKDNKLGASAFIAGSFIENLMAQSTVASESRTRMQCLLVQYQNKALDCQTGVMDRVFETEGARRDIITGITANMSQHLEKAYALLAAAFKQKDAADQSVAKAAADTKNKALQASAMSQLAAADKAIEAASKAVEMAKEVAESQAAICKRNGMDPQLVSRCTAEITQQVVLLAAAIREIGKQESTALSGVLKTSKALFSAAMQAKQGNVPAGPAEEKGRSNNASSANTQAAFFPPSPTNTQSNGSNPRPQADASSSSSSQANISPFIIEIAITLTVTHKVLTVEQAPALKEKLQHLFNTDPNREQINRLLKKERQALAQSVANDLQSYVDELRTGASCDGEFTAILNEQCVPLAGGQKQALGAV